MTRTVLTGSALALVLAASLAGCKDNEESFYIEHMKVLADPPECKYSTGDPFTSDITVDLAMVGQFDYYGVFQVTNALMAREDYDNLKAESNGILIDGSEVAISGPGGGEAGASEYRTVDMFLDAETTGVIPGIAIPQSLLAEVSASSGCLPADARAQQIADAVYEGGDIGAMPSEENLGSGIATVRFTGHTQGDVEVETNQFSFAVNFCCNCFIDWLACINPCDGFCWSSASESCAFGIEEPVDLLCSYWMHKYYRSDETWQEIVLGDAGVEEAVDVNCFTIPSCSNTYLTD